MPPGAASGGQQGAQRAAASVTRLEAAMREGRRRPPLSRRSVAVVDARRRGWARTRRARGDAREHVSHVRWRLR